MVRKCALWASYVIMEEFLKDVMEVEALFSEVNLCNLSLNSVPTVSCGFRFLTVIFFQHLLFILSLDGCVPQPPGE